MIARVWSAQATGTQAPADAEHPRAQVLPAVRRVDGYSGAMLLERAAPEALEIIVLTFWRSLDSIRGFAGADLEAAVVAEEAAALLTPSTRAAGQRSRPDKVGPNEALQPTGATITPAPGPRLLRWPRRLNWS
jgi:heme-degrading monooxygenase HmoA